MMDRRRALMMAREGGGTENGLIPGKYDQNRVTVTSRNRITISTTQRTISAYLPILYPVTINQGDRVEVSFTLIDGTQSGGRWILAVSDQSKVDGAATAETTSNLSNVKLDTTVNTEFTAAYIRYVRKSSSGGVTNCTLDVTMKVNNEVIF